MDNALLCKTSQTSPQCHYSLEKVEEGFLSIQGVHLGRHYFLSYVLSCDGCQGSACPLGLLAGVGWWLQPWGRGALGAASLGQPSRECRLQNAECRISPLRCLCKNGPGNTQASKLTMEPGRKAPLPIFYSVLGKMVFRGFCAIYCVPMFSILHGFTSFCKNELFKSIFPKVT